MIDEYETVFCTICIWKKDYVFIQKYDHDKYWHRRVIVIDPNSQVSTLTKLRYLYYIKKIDAYHGCSFGTNINLGAIFLTHPLFPHGLAGIFVGHDAKVGKNVVIY